MSGVLRRRGLVFVVGAVVLGVVSVGVGTADAHDPIILTSQQTSPAAGPLILDGTISFALYGTLLTANDQRGFRARFRAGDTLTVTLLLPDLAPENRLDLGQRPGLVVTSPDGTSSRLFPTPDTRFTESFSGTKYIQYVSLAEPAVAGDYGFVVQGPVPARFTVAIGVTEKFGTPVNDITNRAVGVAGVKDWYATPPPTLAPQVVVDVTGDPTTVVAPTTTGADARDVVEQTLPATADRSPAVPVVLGASAVAVVGIGGGLFISRRRRR